MDLYYANELVRINGRSGFISKLGSLIIALNAALFLRIYKRINEIVKSSK